MPFMQNINKGLLDWALQGAAPTRPAGLFITWATASPRTDSAFDGPFPRKTCTFAAANSPDGSATLVAAVTGTATAAATAVGWNLYTNSISGVRLAYGTLTASIGCASADNPAFAAGALVITLS